MRIAFKQIGNIVLFILISLFIQQNVFAMGDGAKTEEPTKPTTTTMALGESHSCAIIDGAVVCWGNNKYGQLDVPSLKNPKELFGGGRLSTCARDDEGIKCWGSFFGAREDIMNHSLTLSLQNSQPRQISIGNWHICSLDNDHVICWPDKSYINVPGDLKNPKQISSRETANCAIDNEEVKCWGRLETSDKNFFSASELNMRSKEHDPVAGLKNPRQISLGGLHVCVLDDEGVKCNGLHSIGQLDIPALKNPKQISAGYLHTCALDEEGVKCWGDNSVKQLQVPKLSNPREISAGVAHSCAIDDSGVQCWGWNKYGQAESVTGPRFTALSNTARFLEKLSQHVYKFDQQYFSQLAALVAANSNQELKTLFLMNALKPFFQNFGYTAIKEKDIRFSLQRLEDVNKEKNINSLSKIEGVQVIRKLALQMLAISLQTSQSLQTPEQKVKGAELLHILSNILAGSLGLNDIADFLKNAPKFEAFFLELAQNPYLQARSATDIAILNYLKGI